MLNAVAARCSHAPVHASLLAAKRAAETDTALDTEATTPVVDTVTGRAPELEGSRR